MKNMSDHERDEVMVHLPLHSGSSVATEDVMAELETPLLPTAGDEEVTSSSTSNCSDRDEDRPGGSSAPFKSWVGPSLLLFVSFLFATLNICLRRLYTMPDPPSPSALSATRGWLITTLFLPILFHRKCKQSPPDASTTTLLLSSENERSPQEKSIVMVAVELASWNFLGQALYNWGILFVSSARASFLGQTTVVIIPLISALGGEKLRCWALCGCLCSLIGLILLSIQEDDTSSSGGYSNPHLSLGMGDMLILVSAVCWSFYVIKTAKYAHAFDEVYLQGSKNALLTILYSGWFLASWMQADGSLWNGWRHNAVAWAILLYSAVGPGVVADLIQQKGQESAGATESNLILCMESVFTAILGRVLLGEETSWIEKLGGAFLIAGAFVSGQ